MSMGTAQATPPPAADAAPEGTLANPRSLVDFVLRARTFGIVGILALFVLVTTLIQPSFLSGSNIRFVLSDSALYALVAIGETFVVLTRNVDLSVGSVVGLSAYVSANVFQAHHGTPIPVAFAVGIGIGVACGIVTGLITAIGRVPSLVVTLAMLYIIRGVDTIVVGSGQVVANSLPELVHQHLPRDDPRDPRSRLGDGDPGRGGGLLPAARTAPGATCTRSAPIPTRRGSPASRSPSACSSPSCSRGAIAGLGGVFWATQYNTIDATAANGLELQVIAAVVVGGVAIFGGSGSVVGAALGALLLQTINVALNVLGVPSLWTEAIAGFLLLVAITLDRGIQLKLASALRKRRSHLGA